MRAVLDVTVLISAVLSTRGASARIVQAWRDGAFDLIVSALLLEEPQRAFNYAKVGKRVSAGEPHQFIAWLQREAIVVADPGVAPPTRSPDPGDDYRLALASSERAILVSQDRHVVSLRADYAIREPAEFVDLILADS